MQNKFAYEGAGGKLINDKFYATKLVIEHVGNSM